MKQVTFASLCQGKIADLTSQIKAKIAANTEDKTDPSYISKNTKQNMIYHLRRDRSTIALIQHLLEANPNVQLSDEDKNHLALITTLSGERAVTKYQFAVGDSIFEVMQKYENLSRKDLEKKLEKLGMKLDFATGKIAAAE